MSTEELDLSALPDDELVEQMHDDLYDGLADEIAEGTEILLARGWSPQKVLNEALVEGEVKDPSSFLRHNLELQKKVREMEEEE